MIHNQSMLAIAAAGGGCYMGGITGGIAGFALGLSAGVLAIVLHPHDDEIAMDFIIDEDLVVLDPDDVDPEEARR